MISEYHLAQSSSSVHSVILFRIRSGDLAIKQAYLRHLLTQKADQLFQFIVITKKGVRIRRTVEREATQPFSGDYLYLPVGSSTYSNNSPTKQLSAEQIFQVYSAAGSKLRGCAILQLFLRHGSTIRTKATMTQLELPYQLTEHRVLY